MSAGRRNVTPLDASIARRPDATAERRRFGPTPGDGPNGRAVAACPQAQIERKGALP
jgi:hypothetical protein